MKVIIITYIEVTVWIQRGITYIRYFQEILVDSHSPSKIILI